MDTTLIISILLGITAFISFNTIFEVRFFEGFSASVFDQAETIVDHLGKYNSKRYLDRIKRNRIIKQKDNFYTRYNRTVEEMILDFNLPLTLESFTSLLSIGFAILVLSIVVVMQNITLAFVAAVSIFIGLFTYFVMQSKLINAEKLENIMDAEDIICPLARDGVLIAIKKVMESDEYISNNIKHYFQQFIDNCENNGYSFRQAMTILNRQLGPKFDNFAKKAITFEYNERKGMADVFLDIVDENAVLREINNRKDRIFRKMNRDFIFKTAIIGLFFIYALSVKEFRDFMLGNDLGKIINTILVSAICLSFAKCQSLQGNLWIGGDKK